MKKQNRNHINNPGRNYYHFINPSRCNLKINQWGQWHHHPSPLGRICHRIREIRRTKGTLCRRQTNGQIK